MVLSKELMHKIRNFVKEKPRSVQEIAFHIKKNWRTAERYVEKIQHETGDLSTRTFREGTRGALKIVYWNAGEDIHSISFQEALFEKIIRGSKKHEFSPFEIYQHIDGKKKDVQVEDVSKINPELEITETQDLKGLLEKSSRQVMIFAGNLSWANARQGDIPMVEVVRKLAERGVSFKIIARVSIVGAANAKKLLAINEEIGKDMIEIRHIGQPLRGIIIDDRLVNLKEIRDPSYYEVGELEKKIEIFYNIYDKRWIEWLQKVFWKMFSTSTPIEKRVKEIERIHSKIEAL